MESSDAHHLPEVDSLPDGFVDSSKPLTPQTPTIRQESELDNNGQGSTVEFIFENATRQKTMSLSATDTLNDSSDASVTTASDDHGQDAETVPDLSQTSFLDPKVGCGNADGASGSLQSLDRSYEEPVSTNATETSAQESGELEKGKKLDQVEMKRKPSKKKLFTEKQFLELTLKCQRALTERDAAIAIREKLESLCRELQRQNKVLTDECKRVTTEGHNLRLDLSTRFQDAIKDVGIRLEEQKEECITQLKENDMLRGKLKELADQFALAEQQYAQKLKQKQLEKELAELKNKQLKEKLSQEQSQMEKYAELVSQLQTTEKTLRLQLASDGDKFQEFQKALLKSNEVFDTFKKDLEKMANSIKELKKENQVLKSKCEKSDITLIELVEEREKLKKQVERTKNQKEKLESLCRSLQEQRKLVSAGSNASDATND